jgi:hypothetical protein
MKHICISSAAKKETWMDTHSYLDVFQDVDNNTLFDNFTIIPLLLTAIISRLLFFVSIDIIRCTLTRGMTDPTNDTM